MKYQKGFARHNTMSGFVQIILILIIIAVAIGGAYYFGTLKNKTNLVSVVSTPTPIVSFETVVNPTVKPTADPTTGWKTYENLNAQLFFKYPSNLTEVSGEGGSYVSGPITGKPDLVTGFEDKSTIYPNSDATYDGFTIYEVDPGLIKDFTYNSYLNYELSAVKASPRGIQTATIQTITHGSQSFSYIDSEVNIRRYFILSPDRKRMAIFARINSSPKFLSNFDQILSTFKFTK